MKAERKEGKESTHFILFHIKFAVLSCQFRQSRLRNKEKLVMFCIQRTEIHAYSITDFQRGEIQCRQGPHGGSALNSCGEMSSIRWGWAYFFSLHIANFLSNMQLCPFGQEAALQHRVAGEQQVHRLEQLTVQRISPTCRAIKGRKRKNMFMYSLLKSKQLILRIEIVSKPVMDHVTWMSNTWQVWICSCRKVRCHVLRLDAMK